LAREQKQLYLCIELGGDMKLRNAEKPSENKISEWENLFSPYASLYHFGHQMYTLMSANKMNKNSLDIFLAI